MSRQWLRKARLTVGNAAGNGRDLSELRFTFNVKAADLQTPNAATIRVFNLSDGTSNEVQNEYTKVTLQAGYEETGIGVIFEGEIKQIRRGREDSKTRYLDIVAADGDPQLNFGVINIALAAGASHADQIKALSTAMGAPIGYMPDLTTGQLPRGKALYGMARDHLRMICDSAGLTYSIQNGKLIFLPLNGFKPGEAVVLNAQTGMVGWPEQTENGIKVRCLINPQLEIGCKLQLDNKSIVQALQDPSLQGQLAFANLQASVPLNDDGLYRIYVLEHVGDTRGNDWYSDIICLSIDGTVPNALAAKGQG